MRGAEAASASVRAQDAVQPAAVLLASWLIPAWGPASVARGAVKRVGRQLQKPRLPTSRRQHSLPQLTASAVGAEASAASAGQQALPRAASGRLAWAAAATVAAWEPASSALVVVLVPASRASWPGGAGPSAAFAEQLALPGSAFEQLAWAALVAVAAWGSASLAPVVVLVSASRVSWSVGAEASAASAGQQALPGSASEQLAWAAVATVAVWGPASLALVVVLVPASRVLCPGGAGPSAVFAEQLASPGSASEQLAWAAFATAAAWGSASVPAVRPARPWTSAIVPGRWRGGEYELRKRRGVACVGMQECRRAWASWNRRESWPAWPSSRLKPWAGRRERTLENCRGRGAASVPQACGMGAVQPCCSLWRLASQRASSPPASVQRAWRP